MGIPTKDMLKGIFASKGRKDVTFNSVEIDYNEFDSDNISSVFIYAVSKYGEVICSDPNRMKSILSDLAPHLSKEIKLLQYLCQGVGLNKVLNANDKEDAELLLWVNNAISYLVSNEMIDEKVAYEFCIDFVCDIAGRDLSDAYIRGKEEKAKEKELLNLLEYAQKLISEKSIMMQKKSCKRYVRRQ